MRDIDKKSDLLRKYIMPEHNPFNFDVYEKALVEYGIIYVKNNGEHWYTPLGMDCEYEYIAELIDHISLANRGLADTFEFNAATLTSSKQKTEMSVDDLLFG